ncbi:MAG: hypothetical protein ACXABD_17245 [Candidatus Thorarchaeota archaeon]|jgi:hypothetical protein
MGIFSKKDLAKLQDREPSGGGRISDWFRPSHDKNTGKKATHKVRLLPLSTEDPYPFFFIRSHYYYGKDYLSGICPQVHSKGAQRCPSCDIFFALYNVPELGEEANKGLFKSLSNLGPDQRAYANVYDYATERILTWSIPYARKMVLILPLRWSRCPMARAAR